MNIDLRFMLQLYSNGKALMRNFLTSPPTLREDGKVIIIAVAIDISLHGHRGFLKCAGASEITRWNERALGLSNQLLKRVFVLCAMPEMLKNCIRRHASN